MPINPFIPADDGGSTSRRVTATFIVAFMDTYSDVTNVPGSSSVSDSKTISGSESPGSVRLSQNISSLVPVRTGYDFVCWRLSQTDESQTSINPGDSVFAVVEYGTTTKYYLYSWWSIKTFAITYIANGGTGGPSTQTKNYGQSINITSDTPTRTGYTFVKWNTAPDGSGTDYTAGQVYSTNAALTLYAVWRPAASVPTANKSSVNIGGTVTITTNRADQSATHTLSYSFKGASGNIATNVGASYTWSIPNSFYSLLSTETSAVAVIYCTTYIGGVQSGEQQSLSITITVPDTNKPSLSVSTTAVNEGDLSTILGTSLVQGYSKINFTFTATPSDSAVISSYSITGPDLPSNIDSTASTFVSNTLSGSGTLTWTVYATDSRGRSSDVVVVTANVAAYSRPTISPISAYRCNQDGTQNSYSGLYLNARSFYSAVNVGNNVITSAKVYYKKASTSSTTWTQAIDLTSHTNYGSGEWTGGIGGGNISVENSYEIKYEIQDSIGAATSQAAAYSVSYPVPSSAGISYGIYNDRLRIGGLVEEPGFVVDWASKFKNTVTMQDLSANGITGMIAGEGDNISLLLTGSK